MVTHARKSPKKIVDNHVLVSSNEQMASKIDDKSWEITYHMSLIWRIIRYGYVAAFNQSDDSEELFIEERKNKSKEELLQEYYGLNKLLQSSL